MAMAALRAAEDQGEDVEDALQPRDSRAYGTSAARIPREDLAQGREVALSEPAWSRASSA